MKWIEIAGIQLPDSPEEDEIPEITEYETSTLFSSLASQNFVLF